MDTSGTVIISLNFRQILHIPAEILLENKTSILKNHINNKIIGQNKQIIVNNETLRTEEDGEMENFNPNIEANLQKDSSY